MSDFSARLGLARPWSLSRWCCGLQVRALHSNFSMLDHLVGRLRTATAAGRFNRQLQAPLLNSLVPIIDDLGYRPLSRAEATSDVPARVLPLRKRSHDRHQPHEVL